MPRFIKEFTRSLAPSGTSRGVGRAGRQAQGSESTPSFNSERAHQVARPVQHRFSPQDLSGLGATDATHWSAYSRQQGYSNARVCILVGLLRGGFLEHFELLADRMQDIACANDIAEATAVRFARIARPMRLLLVDVDVVPGTQSLVGDLIAFRQAEPDTPVVIGSRSFRRNDFSVERAAITDASLRLPAASSEVDAALVAAVENHNRLAA